MKLPFHCPASDIHRALSRNISKRLSRKDYIKKRSPWVGIHPYYWQAKHKTIFSVIVNLIFGKYKHTYRHPNGRFTK